MTSSTFYKLRRFLDRLEEGNYWYRLLYIRPETIMVEIRFPGEMWEVEFFEDGHIEFEQFISPGDLFDEDVLERKLAEYERIDNEEAE